MYFGGKKTEVVKDDTIDAKTRETENATANGVFAMGCGNSGRLGTGSWDDQSLPRLVGGSMFSEKLFRHAAADFYHSAVVTEDGDVYTFGGGEGGTSGGEGQVVVVPGDRQMDGSAMERRKKSLRPGWFLFYKEIASSRSIFWDRFVGDLSARTLVQVECGTRFTVALQDNGQVWAWGEGDFLGNPDDDDDQTTPQSVPHLDHIQQIACGLEHSAALATDGAVYTWGHNECGCLGHSGENDCLEVHPVDALRGIGISQISCGSSFTAALAENGVLYIWGSGNNGRLGLGDRNVAHRSPQRVDTLSHETVRQVALGYGHALALTEKGEVYAWGLNKDGQLGIGNRENQSVPVKIPGIPPVAAIYAGGDQSALVTKGGKLLTFGNDKYGVLGHNGVEAGSLATPREVALLADRTVKHVAIGAHHMIVLLGKEL